MKVLQINAVGNDRDMLKSNPYFYPVKMACKIYLEGVLRAITEYRLKIEIEMDTRSDF